MGPRDVLNATENRKIFCSCWESNSDTMAVQRVAIPTELSLVPFKLLIRKENVANVRKGSDML
jgi:hypothetical protein